MSGVPVIDIEDKKAETAFQKLKRKTLKDPFVPLGVLGFISALAYGGYAYKNRGGMSTSIYLMRLRVVSQSMVVGAITIGAGYSAYKTFLEQHAHDHEQKE